MRNAALLIGLVLALSACDVTSPAAPETGSGAVGASVNLSIEEQYPVIGPNGEYVVADVGEATMETVAATIDTYGYTTGFEFQSISTENEPESPTEASFWLKEQSLQSGGGGGLPPGEKEPILITGREGPDEGPVVAPEPGDGDQVTAAAFSVVGRNRILRDAVTYCRMVYLTTETVGYGTARVGADSYVRVLVPGFRSWGTTMNPRAFGQFVFSSRAVRVCSNNWASANIDTNHLGWNWVGMRTTIWGSVYSSRV